MNPLMAPISSIMGEILLVGLQSRGPDRSLMELRTLADWTVRHRCWRRTACRKSWSWGATLKQFQVLTSPERWRNTT